MSFLDDWIRDNTEYRTAVVEFGSGFFDKLSRVHESCRLRIGIEVHEPYIAAAQFHDCIKVHGDFRDFARHIGPPFRDCAMFVDTLEHLTRDDALDLMRRVMESFARVLLMVPEGIHPQAKDPFGLGGDEWQTHKSTWTVEDVRLMGFQSITVDPHFHRGAGGGKSEGCIFAVWNRGQ